MSEAPERIWADGTAEWDSGSWGRDNEFDEDVEYTRTDLVRAQIEAAVKRALEGAADEAKEIADQYVGYMSRIERAIRAIDPAQFVEGDKTDAYADKWED